MNGTPNVAILELKLTSVEILQWLIVMTFGSLTMVNILITGSLLAVVRQARPQVTGCVFRALALYSRRALYSRSDTYFELFKIYVINTGMRLPNRMVRMMSLSRLLSRQV